MAFSSAKSRDRYHFSEDGEKLPGIHYGDDGQHAVFVAKKADRYRLHLANLHGGSARMLIESAVEIREPLIRPRHDSLVYSTGDGVWSIDFNGQHNRRLPLAAGGTPQVRWTAAGRSLLYLNRPGDPRRSTALREFVPEGDADSRIADTTQFSRFHGNSDSSVFIGASGSGASPYLLLLTRAANRELALAEHRSSSASLVNPTFAPNSKFVVFVSDRHGKPAIYWIAVEKLVSETDGT
jgi:oligogalacturonide lyase